MEIVLLAVIVADLHRRARFQHRPAAERLVVERGCKFRRIADPAWRFLVPSSTAWPTATCSRKCPLDVPSQVCITVGQHPAAGRWHPFYFQVTDPMRASYGSSDYIGAITQLAQTTLRSGDRQDGARQDLRGA